MVIEPAEPDEYVEIPERGEVVAEDGGERLDALQPQVFLRGGLWSHSRDFTDPGAVSVAGLVVRAAPRLGSGLDAYGEARAQADSTGRGDVDLEEGWLRFAGGPARLIVPQMYAYKAVKWVNRIELIDKPYLGYWEFHGFETDAWVGIY